MSVIANYVRLSDDQLRTWRTDPNLLQSIAGGRIRGAEHCDVDKAYQAIAWLLSPIKREEQSRLAAAGSDLEARFAVDYSGLEPDLLLVAIEGRGTDEERESRIDYGLGAARVFRPATVQDVATRLRSITAAQFGEHFSTAVMTEQMVEPEIWDEGKAALDECLWPAFEQLRNLFVRAADANQNVVVVYT